MFSGFVVQKFALMQFEMNPQSMTWETLATDNNTHFVENVGEACNLLVVVYAKCGHVVIPVTYCCD
jgi:hypothetical protein